MTNNYIPGVIRADPEQFSSEAGDPDPVPTDIEPTFELVHAENVSIRQRDPVPAFLHHRRKLVR